MASQVLYPAAFAEPIRRMPRAEGQKSDKFSRPVRLAIISALAVASWMPIILLLA